MSMVSIKSKAKNKWAFEQKCNVLTISVLGVVRSLSTRAIALSHGIQRESWFHPVRGGVNFCTHRYYTPP